MAQSKKFTVHQKTEGVNHNNITFATYSDEGKTKLQDSFSIPIKKEDKSFFDFFESGSQYAFVKQD